MTDEHPTLSPSAPPPPTEADYEAIAAAVMGTVRGRWFLAEFAKRNRNADTALILERIDRIEKLLHTPPAAVSPAERVRIDLVEMAKAIARTRSEIAAIRPDGEAKGTLSEASEELGSIVKATERATSDILATAEQIQETAWMLRERGADSAICDALDQRATDIYSACSFQDLTGQRIRKVVDVLQFLEDRIRSMIEIWGGAVPDEEGTPAAVAVPHVGEDRTVPHLEQQDIDRMMPSAPPGGPAANQGAHDVAAAAGARRPDRWPQPGAAGQPGIAASAAPGPAGGIAMAARAAATAGPAEGAAAEPVTAAETVMTPAMAIVGATALAIDLLPTAIVRQPEAVPEVRAEAQLEPTAEPEAGARVEAQAEAEPAAEAQVETEVPAEPQAEALVEPEVEAQIEPEVEAVEAQVEAEAEARPEPEPEHRLEPEFPSEPATAIDAPTEAAHPAPPPEPLTEPAPEIEADARTSEARADPAAVLQRILAIIRAPNDPAAGSITGDAPAPSVAASRPAEPEPEAGVTVAVSVLAPAIAHIVAAHGAGADVLSVDVVAAGHAPAELSAAQPGDWAALRAAAKGVIEETAGDVPMPPAGRLTVDQAVDAMLKAPGRVDVRPTHAPVGAAAPVEASTRGETRAVTAEPADPEAEPAAAPASRSPFVIEAPEFTVAARAPLAAALAPEAARPAETVSDALGAPTAAEATAPDTAGPEEPPGEPVTAALAPLVSPAPPDVTASEPPGPVAPPAAAAAEPARPAPRHPALAAITALSDEEKIALFS